MVVAKPKPGSDSAMPLLKALFRCFGIDMLVLTIPRLLSTAFRYTQPILINRTIQYVTRRATESDETRDDVTGTQIIFAAVIIYSGTTVSNTSKMCCASADNTFIDFQLHL